MGKYKSIESPEKLWEYWLEYKSSLQLIEVPISHVKLGITYLKVPEPIHERSFNVWCCNNIDLGKGTIHKYFINEGNAYDEYRTTITRIKDDIFQHNYKYSAVGLHKEKLTMALLGLAQKSEEKVETRIILEDESKDYTSEST